MQFGDDLDLTPWGKSRGLERPYPLMLHMVDTAAMALRLWDDYLAPGQCAAIGDGLGLGDAPERVRALVGFWAGLHDLGKLTPGFQQSDDRGWWGVSPTLRGDLGRAGEERIGHAEAGMRSAQDFLTLLGYTEQDELRAPLNRIAQMIGGHHGRFTTMDPRLLRSPAFQRLLGGDSWRRQRSAYSTRLHELLGSPPPPTGQEINAPAAMLITGVVILADWLVSQEGHLKERQRHPAADLTRHFVQSCKRSAHLLSAAGLNRVVLTRRSFTDIHDVPAPNPLQQSLIDQLSTQSRYGAGIAVVTAATGDGKTEAALEFERLLSRWSDTQGFAFLLPTMATSDQMYKRVSKFVSTQCTSAASVTLTHSMAWLSDAYASDVLDLGSDVLECDEVVLPTNRQLSRPASWLRGGKRPLLAQFAVGTVDQALMAALPVKHNALRMLALTGKTVIVDEAHAYDPYMQVLLGRLLHWLGAYRCPVVLLSATLPRSVSDQLIRQYLLGSGSIKGRRAAQSTSFGAPYPGWLFVDAADGATPAGRVQISERMLHAQTEARSSALAIEHFPVWYDMFTTKSGHDTSDGREARSARIEALLESLLASAGGCALLVCTTVDGAQQSYAWLKSLLTHRGLDTDCLILLHARLPAETREGRSEQIADRLGRNGRRPHRQIVVATQVVEQSLDLDTDLVISDLAPLAQLLQRAGRCWRHENWWSGSGSRPSPRPAWASQPRMAVLDPLDAAGAPPKPWGEVYHPYLLKRTSDLLRERHGTSVSIPQEVQQLVERIHGDAEVDDTGNRLHTWDQPGVAVWREAHLGEKLAQESVAAAVAIPTPRRVVGLESLSRLDMADDEWRAATRLGADSVRILCCYVHSDDRVTLDLEGEEQLPEPDSSERLAPELVRRVMKRTIAVRAAWLDQTGPAHQPPASWEKQGMLADLVLLRQQVRDGVASPVPMGSRTFEFDPELGLIRR